MNMKRGKCNALFKMHLLIIVVKTLSKQNRVT